MGHCCPVRSNPVESRLPLWLHGVADVGNGRTIAWAGHDDEFSSRDRSLAVWQSSLQKEGEPDVKLNGELHRDHRPSLRCDELEAMLIYSMSVSVDGLTADADAAFGWTRPRDQHLRVHIALPRDRGRHADRRGLYP